MRKNLLTVLYATITTFVFALSFTFAQANLRVNDPLQTQGGLSFFEDVSLPLNFKSTLSISAVTVRFA
jgi:hypothetical protein